MQRFYYWLYTWVLHRVDLNSKFIYTTKQRTAINKFKVMFRIFFEGYDQFSPQINDMVIPIRNFEIRNFNFYFKKDKMFITIELRYPSILIGKSGNTITNLLKYLNKNSEYHIEINIKDSDLWNRL